MTEVPPPISRLHMGCLVLLGAFSAGAAVLAFPHGTWTGLLSALAVLAVVSIFLRAGWSVTFTIAGFYFGVFVLNPAVKMGLPDDQIREAFWRILIGTVIGFIIGSILDAWQAPEESPEGETGSESE